MSQDESIPSENPVDTPLSEVTDRVDGSGTAQFQVVDAGDVLCLTCRNVIPADAVDASRATRLEGASDPADMTMVVPVECSACGADGSLVVAYGPNAGEAESDFLVRSQRSPTATQPGVTADDPETNEMTEGARP